MNITKTLTSTTLELLLAGQSGFVHLPAGALLSENERAQTLATLRQTPYTFEWEGLPPCWGKAFENYLTMAEYLARHPLDAKIDALCNPIREKAIALFTQQGIRVAPLRDAANGINYTTADFRTNPVAAGDTILHVDDLRLDAIVKPDFVLPESLQGHDFVQLSVIVMLEADHGVATLRSYDRKYAASDDAHRLPNGWQFSDAAVEGAGYQEFQPQTGDAFIMNNQYFHDILGADQADSWCMYSMYFVYIEAENLAWMYV